MVPRNNAITTNPPRLMGMVSVATAGRSRETVSDIKAAGMSQFTREGKKRTRNCSNGTTPFCHTMSVVMSPNGLKAPPALAATTMLIQAAAMKRLCPGPAAMATAPMTSAVVRLSAMGERKKAKRPVHQKMARRENPAAQSQARSASKTWRSSRVLT